MRKVAQVFQHRSIAAIQAKCYYRGSRSVFNIKIATQPPPEDNAEERSQLLRQDRMR